MAKYIDLDKVEFLKVEGNEEFNHGVDCCINKLLKIESVDVIERSKIDKAIEELRKEIEENRLNVIDYADGEWIVKDFVYGAIDRLREKIGE